MQLTEHFELDEWTCRDEARTPVPDRYISRVAELAEQLEVLRLELGGRPIKITSGYRTPEYNRSVGGVKNSQHVQCRAADIVVKGVGPKRVGDTIKRLIREGRMKQGGVGVYNGPKNYFCHYDIRPGRAARWTGR